MTILEAQAMLTRLQELAGEWAEKGSLCCWREPTYDDGDRSLIGTIGMEWGETHTPGSSLPGVVLEITDDGGLMTIYPTPKHYRPLIMDPTPAQLDAAVRRVMSASEEEAK